MWTRKAPEPPEKKPSQFYWYYDLSSKERWAVELWPGRYVGHYEGWWWCVPIDTPPLGSLNKQLKK